MAMRWHNLLFMHWPIRPEVLRPLIPAVLALDTFEGWAWLGVVPFRMTGVRPHYLPALPYLSAFPELNVRTYVTTPGRSGVWFFSLDAASRLAVAVARALFHLPYVYARMHVEREGDGIRYRSQRPDGPAFLARYRPSGPAQPSARGTLEYFLTERYCLYARPPGGAIHRAEIDHQPWPLQPAVAEIERNDMPAANGIAVEGHPLAHYAERLNVVIGPLRSVRGS
jgi:hypothetical protein